MENGIRADVAAGRPTNMTMSFYYVAYNVMRDLAFGEEADEHDEEWQPAYSTIHNGLSQMGPLVPVPWITSLVFSFSYLPFVRNWHKLLAYTSSKMAKRIAMDNGEEEQLQKEEKKKKKASMTEKPEPRVKRDVASWIIADARKRGTISSSEEMRWLNGDAFTLIIAGSDTTALTFLFATWQLAQNPAYQAQIYEELKAAVSQSQSQSQSQEQPRSQEQPQEQSQEHAQTESESDNKNTPDTELSGLDSHDMERLAFLNALINETLRLYHPLPSTGSRVMRDKGLEIGGRFIPPGTNVVVPRWSHGRNPSLFARPLEFLPERWLLPDGGPGALVADRRAFTPFGGGKWSCIGKQIGLYELRYSIALVVWNYTFSLPPGDDGSAFMRDYKDSIAGVPGQLNLVFTPRG